MKLLIALIFTGIIVAISPVSAEQFFPLAGFSNSASSPGVNMQPGEIFVSPYAREDISAFTGFDFQIPLPAPQPTQSFPIATPYHPPNVPPTSPDPAGFIDVTKGNLDWQHQSGFGGHGGVGMGVHFIPGVTLESAETIFAKEYFSFDYRIVVRNENPLEIWIFMNEYDAEQLAKALKKYEEVTYARAGMIA